ncbi:hypothetical protein B0F89_101125 [Malaciobacter marinus]|jgi:hypothetical protein|uniref:Lipoprotein n=1 Tax=Malaciobacter marinus TaxID=505249 RepID=A0AB36ZZM6_9BACT|nr:hypothetical protein [Malaciobacter marinus]PPK62926.1 hypothetical protein B0F89_101125 [Malaciobacter marinus]SKB38061.1 hypothetical protein SAMN06295997_10852 [Malaciobacter marinus]
MIKNLIVLASLIFLLSACSNETKKEEWTSWVYPDKSNTKRSMKNGVYKSLEECKQASINKIEELDLSKKASYKCGLNCTYHENMKTDVCKKIAK